MKRLRHENLINYRTCTSEMDENCLSIYFIRDHCAISVKAITRSVGWTEKSAQKIIFGLLNAVQYLHKKSIWHGYISESTVFVGKNGQCKIADFALIPYLNALKHFDKTAYDASRLCEDLRDIGKLIRTFRLNSAIIEDFITKCESSDENMNIIESLMNHPFLTKISISSRFHKDYRIMKHLGSGGYGAVFKVQAYTDKKKYAMKLVKLDENVRDSKELEVLSGLEHPNIVRYHTSWIGKIDDTFYREYAQQGAELMDVDEDVSIDVMFIQMELCDEQSLK